MIRLSTSEIHTVKPLEVEIPKGRLTVVTGVSGSGKTTLVLESLVPGLEASIAGRPMPEHVKLVKADGIGQVKLIDATPIGINVRSTVATYANIHDELRKIYARTKRSKTARFQGRRFFLQHRGNCAVLSVTVREASALTCSFCRMWISPARNAGEHGMEKKRGWFTIRINGRAIYPAGFDGNGCPHCPKSLPGYAAGSSRLRVLEDLGLGYLTLGEETPSLSGGEAQRLKLASEMGKSQTDSVFVFDEPTIGLHPLDVQNLLSVFQTLILNGATVIVIEHDLDVIRCADYIVDMGPGGGEEGGRIVAAGTPEEIKNAPQSVTGKYL